MDENIINECQTLAQLDEIEKSFSMTEQQQRSIFERRLEIFHRIARWRTENQEVGLVPTISDFRMRTQREQFLAEWNDDQAILEANNRGGKRSPEEVSDDYDVQIGRGQDDERPFNIESVTQVNIKKFKTTGMN